MQEDGFWCGLLALAHQADLKKYPLIKASEVDDARLEMLFTILERHSDQLVSYIIYQESVIQSHLDSSLEL
jgi:hypothetical protein